MSAIIIGLIAGALVVGSVILFDKIKIDDPVGATSVHLVNGIWGTLAVGIFSTNAEHTFLKQLIGVGVYGAFTVVASFVLFSVTKLLMGLRVDIEEETGGLDFGEHGMHAYDLGGGTTRGLSAGESAAAPASYAATSEPATSAT